MTGIQDTKSNTYRQLFGNGLTYVIPKFQRDYSWTSEQWDDLWQDIQSVLRGDEPGHYMGYLVLQTENNKVFKVIDGQQRLTTLSILILAVLKSLHGLIESGVDPDRNKRRMEALRNSYIGYLDPVTLVASNKIHLNRNNDDYYRTYLVPLDQLKIRNTNASEKLMRQCFNWFHDRLRREYTTGEALAGLVDTIVDKLVFTVITVGDDLNAFKVFETLNARGVQLSAADLLKNYLFSVVDTEGSHTSELREIEELWAQVMSTLGDQRFEEFLRVYWNSRRKNVRKNELFKVIRKHIRHKGEAFALLRDLRRTADLFMALRNPEDELWKADRPIQYHLEELRMFQVRQHLPLLMSAHESLDKAGFHKVLEACSVISLRYNVIGGLNPNEQDRVYNDAALRIHKEKQFALSWLQEVYPDDESFETTFSNVAFKDTSRNNKIVRYLLASVERRKHQTEVDPFGESMSIEHVMPRSAVEDWGIDDDVYERCVFRLGNLTLLEASRNKDASSKLYTEKRGLYEGSTFGITRAIAEHYSEWGEEQISKRQKQLAKQARDIWSLRMS
ncbi:MAG: DUF262 domain-containing protein [Flavobacteriales bacterium]|nr:DUF262 domain-containing protein [Flavobacteriales bacterium]